MYVLNLGQYDKSFGEYDSTQDSAQVMRRHYQDIVRAVRTCPEVEAFTVSAYSSFPNGMSWSGMELFNEDSVRVHVQQYRFIPLDGSDLPKTYGMVDVRTGQPVTLPADFAQRRMIALSERAARDLFGTTDAVGLTVYESPDRENPHEVAAVFRNYKHYTSEQPYPMAVMSEENLRMVPFTANIYHIVFRLKDGVDADAFETRFRAEVAPQLSRGNFYFDSLKTFGDYSRQTALSSGVTNKLRLQYALGGFALLCIFLGMVGTFYIRANARREEVGILRAMGVSRAGIVRRFLAESWVLVTVAYALALLVVANGGQLRLRCRVCRGHQCREHHEGACARPGLSPEPSVAALPQRHRPDLCRAAADGPCRDVDTRAPGGADIARGGVAGGVNTP